MPESLKNLLSSEGKEKFVVILEDRDSSLYHKSFVTKLVQNLANGQDGKTELELSSSRQVEVHIIMYVLSKDALQVPVFHYVYDELDQQIDELWKKLVDNRQLRQDKNKQIVVIDDLSLLSLLSAERNTLKLSKFLKNLSHNFDQTFVFGNRNTLTNQEVSRLYEVASSIAVLEKYKDFEKNVRNDKLESSTMLCNILKLRNERRTSHEQTKFQISNGDIIELKESSASTSTKDQQDVLRNLTTFKLTVEDNEKQTRSQLYLPYFNAQKNEMEAEDFDDYDEEDDDEV